MHARLQGMEFVWSNDSNEYAIRESPTKVKLYKNFQVRRCAAHDLARWAGTGGVNAGGDLGTEVRQRAVHGRAGLEQAAGQR